METTTPLQQDTPPAFGGSISGESIETINVTGNTVNEVLKALASAPRVAKAGDILGNAPDTTPQAYSGSIWGRIQTIEVTGATIEEVLKALATAPRVENT